VPQAERTSEDVLTVEGVAVRFGGVAALSDANLRVRAGTVTGLIGPNGAGKTTLFNVISGLQTPDRGSVHLYDTDITRMKPHRRARLGLARTFQRLELFGSLSAGENVQVGLESSVKWWQWRHVKRAFPWSRRSAGAPGTPGDATGGPDGQGDIVVETSDRLLEGVGLGGLGAEQASAMPTGLARMVELARALAMAPKVLLLDEPGSGLDDAESEALGQLLTTLANGGMGVLLVEHDMELVMRICDFIYVLDFGDVIAAGTPGEIRKNPMVQAAYLGAVTETEADAAADAHDAPAGVQAVAPVDEGGDGGRNDGADGGEDEVAEG
jgi:branched-chain amino acid transport system ATP-binding protein